MRKKADVEIELYESPGDERTRIVIDGKDVTRLCSGLTFHATTDGLSWVSLDLRFASLRFAGEADLGALIEGPRDDEPRDILRERFLAAQAKFREQEQAS